MDTGKISVKELLSNYTKEVSGNNKDVKWPRIEDCTTKGEDMLIGTAFLCGYPAYWLSDVKLNISSSVFFEYNIKTGNMDLWTVDSKTHNEFCTHFDKKDFIRDKTLSLLREEIQAVAKKVKREKGLV